MVFVAGMLFVFIGVAALAVDLGLLQDERSDTQNAADLGALRAAWAACNGESDPAGAGISAIAVNGYSAANGDTVTVTSSGSEWTATIDADIDSEFAGVFGVNTLGVQSQAVAECASGGGGGDYAIFGGSEACQNTVDWSGSTTEIYGNVHTNNDLKIGGSSNDVYGDGTYVDSIDPPNHDDKLIWHPDVDNPTQLAGPIGYPVDYDIADYAPGGAVASVAAGLGQYYNAGNNKIDMGWLDDQGLWNDATDTMADGIYYTTDDISLSASDINGTITLISDGGEIDLSGSSHVLRPYDDTGLLAFTTYIKNPSKDKDHPSNCNVPGIKLAGSTHDWEGIIYAPNAEVEMSGSSNTTLEGSIIANTVKLNGSSLSITSNSDYGSGGDPVIGLRH